MVIIVTKDGVEPDCIKSIYNLDYKTDDGYAGFSVLVHIMQPRHLHDEPRTHGVKNVVRNRNYTKQMALASEAEYFLWVDSDVVLPPHAISSLISHKKDIIGGWYKMINTPKWVAGGWISDNVFQNYLAPQTGITIVDMVGLGCVLMSREVMEKVDFRDGMDLLCKDSAGNQLRVGECNIFGTDARNKGFSLYMDGNVICGHLERKATGNTYQPIKQRGVNNANTGTDRRPETSSRAGVVRTRKQTANRKRGASSSKRRAG